MSHGERVFRFLLRAYPTEFRRRYGAEMERLYRDQAREARSVGGDAAFGLLWMSIVVDTVRTAPLERVLERRMAPRPVREAARAVELDANGRAPGIPDHWVAWGRWLVVSPLVLALLVPLMEPGFMGGPPAGITVLAVAAVLFAGACSAFGALLVRPIESPSVAFAVAALLGLSTSVLVILWPALVLIIIGLIS